MHNIDFGNPAWIVALIALGTLLVNLGINISAVRENAKSNRAVAQTVQKLDRAREEHGLAIADHTLRIRSLEESKKLLHGRTHKHANILMDHNARISENANRLSMLEDR